LNFDRALAWGNEGERAIVGWLQAHGSLVLPAYAFTGGGARPSAPKLGARVDAESVVTPDALLSAGGCTEWVEVKRKSSAYPWRAKGNLLMTGLSKRLWREYERVQAETGMRVYVAFCHEAEDVVTLDSLAGLAALEPIWESESASGMGPMISFPFRMLTRVARWSEVLAGMPPSQCTTYEAAPIRAVSKQRREDPIPINGLAATTYCTLFALEGQWRPLFVKLIEGAYGSPDVPQRFVQKANEIRVRRRGETCACGVWQCSPEVHREDQSQPR